MLNTLKVSAFIVVVVGVIAGFATLIPQVESPAPAALEITGALSGPELANVGEAVFQSAEAGCLTCHAIGREGLRGPDLAGVGARAAEPSPGKSAEAYLREALTDPCAYVVEGFDCIMPPNLAQTLGPAKITALIAFLQSQGGEITVTLSEEVAAQAGAGSSGGQVGVPGTTAEEIITNVGCPACHRLDATGAQGVIGPDLSQVGAKLTPDQIRQSILDPDAVLAENCSTSPCVAGVMPKTFGNQLNAGQLETLVEYLSNLGGPLSESADDTQ